MADETISCVEPAGGVAPVAEPSQSEGVIQEEVKMTVARAGAKAPEFEGMAYYQGGFKKFSLSDYQGEWTVICFYPGDFTFV